MFNLYEFAALEKEDVVLELLTAKVPLIFPVMKTPTLAGLVLIAERSPPKAPIEPAIALNLAEPVNGLAE